MKLRAVMADDEELAREVLREHLLRDGAVEIVAECSNGFEAVKAIHEMRPDVVFLDVQMPKLDGFEVLELASGAKAVVFVTAYDEYAMRAFDAAAVDYLLKPFSETRLTASLARVRARLGSAPSSAEMGAHELKQASRRPGEFLERIVVKDGPRVHVIPVGKLDYAVAQDDYVSLRSEGRSWLKQQTIGSLEAALDPRRFIRTHRSHLVNLQRIARIEPNTKDTWLAVLVDGTTVPVSRAGYTRFRELVGDPG
ncbi:MAG: transcriptional regulator, LytR/AlgR family [Bryobacterales bacterium]|nr:transcriptional regulator, LytR/AlgR family [Bryobacterales bacterium]